MLPEVLAIPALRAWACASATRIWSTLGYAWRRMESRVCSALLLSTMMMEMAGQGMPRGRVDGNVSATGGLIDADSLGGAWFTVA